MRCLKPILRCLLSSPTRIAVIDDQRSWKAFHLYVGSLHLARAIAKSTSKPHVGIMLPTSGLFPLALIAAWRLGRTAVPLNYLLNGDELAYVINDADIDTVISVGPMLAHIPLPPHIKLIKLDDLKFTGIPPWRPVIRRPDDVLAVLLYTSGTSGKPKGVMLSSNNLASNVDQCVEWAGFTSKDVVLGVLPQFHTFGLTVLTLLPLAIGATVVYTARFNPAKLLMLMRKHHPTAFIAIPSMFNALLHAKSAKPEDFASLRFAVSGGEPLPLAVLHGFKERFNLTLNEGYGLTETSPVTNWCRPHEHKTKSVGKPLPGVLERIVDPNENILGPNQDGEVRIKGPNIMQGYYKLPELTASVFDKDGYFKTGDMGRLDEHGHLFITGRIKEMLIIGGENVFPREIEEVLNAHPAIHESAVIGITDESRGEVPIAFVELKPDASFDEKDLRAWCRNKLAQFKIPREFRLLEKLPRNPTGKIQRRALNAQTPSIASSASAASSSTSSAEKADA